ncbi:MAG: TonB-dependent receptor plug domain-containing protein [Opitutaceae bacterium]
MNQPPMARRSTKVCLSDPPRAARRFKEVLHFLAACSACNAAVAVSSGLSPGALKQLSLDELLNIEVTSVSKTAEDYRDVAAAITVVNAEHIRRSGATSVPDALRWVPGIHVARRNSNSWAVASRGFSSINSQNLLVLSDTRSIYTPLLSGVAWDVQDYLMADIERIEVIRGPGASLWGSNAVNGVINITTKHAADTHGVRIETAAGTEEHAMVAARYGDQTSGGIHYRVFGKYFDRDDTFSQAVSSDDWRMSHLGFRADWATSAQDEFTVQGDVYRGNIGQLAPSVSVLGRPGPTGDLETQVAGGSILGRWRHTIDESSDIQFRAYYDRTHRDDPSFTDDLDTIDLDLQHRFNPIVDHEIVWGLNYRYTSNRNEGKGIFEVRPPSSEDDLVSAFVQDQFVLRDALRVTVGTKFGHNDFSGDELQPGVRAAWDVVPGQTLWAAISRAARIPARLERDVYIDASDPAGNPVFRLLGNEDFGSEELVAYEIGYRWRASETLHIDVALFENRYDDIASLELGDPFLDPETGQMVVPVVNRNLTEGRARGAEALVTFSPFARWRLSGSYSYLDMSLDSSGLDLNRGEFFDGATPRHQFALGSYLTLDGGFEVDVHFRSVSDIRRVPDIPAGEGIPGYSELDIHLSWRASDQMRIALVGRNLLHDHHPEFGTPEARGEIERSVYARIAWDL